MNQEGVSDFEAPPTMGQSSNEKKVDAILELLQSRTGGSVNPTRTAFETANIYRLIRAYRSHGHLLADVDPIGMAEAYAHDPALTDKYKFPNEDLKAILDPRTYGFTEADLEKTYFIDLPNAGAILGKKKDWVLKDLI
jgi:2-oxoglutarate dehydrogenase complex dehydrogenase (E1) component-like enzyme